MELGSLKLHEVTYLRTGTDTDFQAVFLPAFDL